MYPHSVALGARRQRVVQRSLHARARARRAASTSRAGAVDSVALAPHPTLDALPGGPDPVRDPRRPDGVVWTSELHGNRLQGYDPRTRRTRVVTLPDAHAGPRRFDVGADGVLWIPGYASGALYRYDPRADRVTRLALPIRDAAPYVARVDRATGDVWIGTGAADAVLRYAPRTGRFEVYPLPTRGALVRHLALDARGGAVWIAYGAAPGPAARIARLAPAPR
jgi:virginiamycin B lyase